MSHPNAALTPRHRLKVAQLVVEEGWPISEAAARFQVSWPTVKRWVDRYRAGEPMHDRSSRPKSSPNKTSKPVTKRCVNLRIRLREGPVQLSARLGIAPSTVHRILTTARLNRLSHVDRATGEPIRRYEHAHPGSLVHVDVKKLGNIPDGGGWRYVGRRQGDRNRVATPDKPRNQHGGPKLGYAYVHTVIDDHSRVAYTEIHDDETAVTAVGVLQRAVNWFAERGVTIERVLSDNGGAYRSNLWRGTCEALSIRPRYTRPYRPQTNGKVERFHRTMADGWAYARCYCSEAERRDALESWLHHYNHHRPHTACANQPPFTRLINVPGQYTAVCSGVAAALLTLLVASLTGVASPNLGPSHHFGELARDRDSWHSREGLLYTVTAARMATSDQRDRDHLEFEVVVINDSSHYREDTLPEVRCEAGGEEHEATAGAELPQSGLHPSEGAFGASAVLEFSCPVPSGTDREHVAVSLLADGRKMEFTDPLNSSSRVLRGEDRDGLW